MVERRLEGAVTGGAEIVDNNIPIPEGVSGVMKLFYGRKVEGGGRSVPNTAEIRVVFKSGVMVIVKNGTGEFDVNGENVASVLAEIGGIVFALVRDVGVLLFFVDQRPLCLRVGEEGKKAFDDAISRLKSLGVSGVGMQIAGSGYYVSMEG